jgi:hypothetical protein
MWRVEFTSADFLPYLPEDCQANPGVYGYELAHWLSRALMDAGVVTSYPMGEDWGWLIEYLAGELEVTIGCSSMADEGEGYDGKPISWSIFVRPHQSLKQRLLRSGTPPSIAHLTQAIEAALVAKGIQVRHDDEP